MNLKTILLKAYTTMRLYSSILALALLSLLAGCTSPASESIVRRLSEAAAAGTPLYGHQDDLMYGHEWNATDDNDENLERSDVYEVCGSYPAILGLDLGGIEIGQRYNLDGNEFNLMRMAAQKHYERGGIVSLSWHLRNPVTGGDSWDISEPAVVTRILEEGEIHERFMTWLERVGDYINSLEMPVIFRPWHEHSGSWFWWGREFCTAEEYNALWILTYEKLSAICGEGTITWAISPNSVRDFERWTERYPGDEYVDIVGLDCYCPSQGKDFSSFTQEAHERLSSLAEFAREHKKILAFNETGQEGLTCANWWTSVLSPALKGLPVSYVLTWRNASDEAHRGHYYGPWKGEHSAEDFCRWIEQDKIGMIN